MAERNIATTTAPPFPMTPVQQGMYFHSLADRVGTYNQRLELLLEGPLDGTALHAAWQRVCDRHEALRTRFIMSANDEPVQIVNPEREILWEEEGWRDLSRADQETRLTAMRRRDAAHNFNLAAAPPLRFALLSLAEERHHLVLHYHHILMDGWSLALAWDEAWTWYRALRNDEVPDLAEAMPFRSFVTWLDSRDQALERTFWREMLAGFSAPTPLRVRGSSGLAHSGKRENKCERHLDEALHEALVAMARRRRVTFNTLFQAAWALLLSRYSGTGDIVHGVACAGRPRTLANVRNAIGMFINTLPLRCSVAATDNLAAWLAAVQKRVLDLYRHEHASLVHIQGWTDVPRDVPIFESIVVFENVGGGLEARDEVAVSLVESQDKPNYPLALYVKPGQSTALELVYDPDTFEAAIIDGVLRHLINLLGAFTLPDETQLADLDHMDQAERRHLVHTLNETFVAFEDSRPIHLIIAEQAQRRPEAIALSCEGNELSYGALESQANRVAHALLARGLGADQRVGLCMERSFEMLTCLVGVLKAGAAYVPLDPDYPTDRLTYMMQDAAIETVLSHRGLADKLSLTQVRVLDWENKDLLADMSEHPPETEFADAQLAYVIYTSGSTGQPKGVMISHGALRNRMLATPAIYPIDETDVVVQKTPFSFDLSIWELFYPLMVGARLVLAKPGGHRDSAYLAALLARERVTSVHFVPSMMRLFLEEPELAGISTLRRAISGGEALPLAVARRWHERFPAVPLWNLYGPTEATLEVAHWRYDGSQERTAISIGKPIANCGFLILDETMEPVPLAVPGRLYIGGLQLARGYHNRPALTAERFTPHPFAKHRGERLYQTGDLARYSSGGDIDFLGREDFQVKVRGHRIELGEIEVALGRHERLRQVCIVDRDFGGGDVRLVAYLVAASEVAPRALGDFLAQSLPGYMVPSHFVFLAALPMLPNGKVDRKALPHPIPTATPCAKLPPAGRLQEAIAAVWREVLGLESISVDDNFFDLGGHSLTLLKMRQKLVRTLDCRLELNDLFRHASVRELARFLAGENREEVYRVNPEQASSGDIAVIAMAGRFPDATHIETFWHNLETGSAAMVHFNKEELVAAGQEPELVAHPDYVPVNCIVADADAFDAGFFGYNPREAELLDPQQRIFLELAYETLERAGYARDEELSVGVFAGSAISTYLLFNLVKAGRRNRLPGGFHTLIQNDKDFIATRTSYKLNLKGPSVSMGTACSTSLVAVHLACRSILSGECAMALAGGISVRTPQVSGYLYEEGGTLSPDGLCRAFDAEAGGTVGADGAGLVLLKKLERARVDGDQVLAVIKGTAINNDGSGKIGFTAPSESGQARAIQQAQANAGVTPESISYVETHGTATRLGDPIEIAALTRAFGTDRERRGSCAIGSVKTNIGHTDAAAGVAGLIKTVFMLRHRKLVPSLHFQAANPKIDFASGPFYVNTKTRDWDVSQGPRRAGVSSFGIGGTNAHAILEEAPLPEPSEPGSPCQLLLLSARSEKALTDMCARLHAWLETHPEAPLADLAFTLQTGRRCFSHRRALICRNGAEAKSGLGGQPAQRVFTRVNEARERPIAFLFPGQGCQYPGMTRGLYATVPVFRQWLDRCNEILAEYVEDDLLTFIFQAGDDEQARSRLRETPMAQPAVFSVCYALARMWQSWGVAPAAMLGHSLGEYVAACLAGVFSLEDALRLVAARARIMAAVPEGRMIAVPLGEDHIAAYLAEGIALAIASAPDLCILSGSPQAVAAARLRLEEDGIQSREMALNLAAHSPLMAAAAPAFLEILETVELQPAEQAYISNVTGAWIEAEAPADPSWWVRHMLETVRFNEGVGLLAQEGFVLLEVGPNTNLCNLLDQRDDIVSGDALPSVRHPRNQVDDLDFLTAAVGRLWLAGAAPDWARYHEGKRRLRLELPTYPFERRRYWLEPATADEERPAAELIADPEADSSQVKVERMQTLYPRPELEQEYVAPGDALESSLAALWAEHLGFERVGIRDNFFELGGNSMLGLKIVNQANSLAIPITVVGMNLHQTIAELARLEEVRAVFENRHQEEGPPWQSLLPLELQTRLNAATERPGVEAAWPLGPMQRTLIDHCREQPGDYLQRFSCRLEGPLQPRNLERAWQATTTAFAALRTSFDTSMEPPIQIVNAKMRVDWQLFDWRQRSEAEQDRDWSQLMHRWSRFDLAQPPHRLQLVRLDATRWRLDWCWHHLLLDPFAATMVWNHLWAAYDALQTGTPLPVAEAHQFERYLDWLSRRDQEASRTFWQETFSGWHGPPNWRHPKPTGNLVKGTVTAHFELAAAELARIRAYIRPRQWTVPNILEPLWALVLHRLWGRDDISFALKFFGRPNQLPGMHLMVGPCANLVPCRIRIDGNEPLSSLLERFREHVNAVHDEEFQSYAEVCAWSGQTAATLPLLSEVALERFRHEEALAGTNQVYLSEPDWRETNPVPLKLSAASLDDCLKLRITYDQTCFTAALIAAIGRALRQALIHFSDDPDRDVAAFSATWLAPMEPFLAK